MKGPAHPLSPYKDLTLQEKVDIKRKARMDKIDQFDPAIRSLIHEYGLTVVQTLIDLGVKKPKHIKHVVEVVLNEFSPTRGSYSAQGIRTYHEDK